jgi:hypothetical protein
VKYSNFDANYLWHNELRGFAKIGILARPPRPETGTGSGGATRMEYDIITVISHE